MSLWSTYKMPCRPSRSATGRAPGDFSDQVGANGFISAHNSSSTIHGRCSQRLERRNRHIGRARPGHFNKIGLRASRDCLTMTGAVSTASTATASVQIRPYSKCR